MATLQCECGQSIELILGQMRIECPQCGRRFSVPQPDDVVEDNLSTGQPTGSDLPMVTSFEDHYAQSIVAVGMFSGVYTSAGTELENAPSLSLPAVRLESLSAGLAAGVAAGVGAIGHSVRSGGSPAVQVASPNAPAAAAGASASNTPLNTPAGHRSTRRSRRRDSTADGQPVDAQLSPGQVLLGRYEVVRKIGQGGMSSVYEACDRVRGEQVALKVLLPHLAARPKMQDRFLQEGRLSSNFSHPNIARVYDLHQTDEHILLSMELLQGSTLRHDMHRRKTQGQSYRPAEVVSILSQVTSGLSVVHAAGIVHRDLKPENLWLGLDGTVKVMDFGIARESTRGAHTTGPRGSGTPYYIAPEQLAASPMLDHRADQYSLAIIAYELLTGELPQGAVAPPHMKHPHIPKRLSQAILRGLNADPTQRYPTIEAFQNGLVFERRLPWLVKCGLSCLAVAALGAGGYAFERYGMPWLETKHSPVWASIDKQSVVEGETLTIDIRHADCWLAEKELTFKLLSDAPRGAEVRSGQIVWTPAEDQGPKQYRFNVMAVTRIEGQPISMEERTVEVDVAESFDPPRMDTPEPVTLKEHAALELPIKASDPNLPAVGLRYELIEPPAGMSIDSRNGIIRWTPREETGNTHPSVQIRVSLDDESHRDISVTRRLNLHVEETIDPLTFTSAEKLTAEVGEAVSFRATANDPNTPPLNSYFRLRGGDRVGMTIDPKSGELFWTPDVSLSDKDLEVTIDACWDDGDKTQALGSQLLKVHVAEYKPPKTKEDSDRSPSDATSAPVAGAAIGGTPAATGSVGTCPTIGTGGGRGGNNSNGNANGNAPCNTNGNTSGNTNGNANGNTNGGGNCPNAGNNNGGNRGSGNATGIGNGLPAQPIGGRIIEEILRNKLPADKLPTNKLPLPLDKLPGNKLPGNRIPIQAPVQTSAAPVQRPAVQLPAPASTMPRWPATAPSVRTTSLPRVDQQGPGSGQKTARGNNQATPLDGLKRKLEQELKRAR